VNGKGDLNGDGLITATELAAYVAPAVASVSNQTPAFGSLPGSEGGDFVFELPAETEFLSPQSAQLSTEAIALNSKLDAARPEPEAKPAPVTVKDLSGKEQKLVTPAAVPSSMRQLAQRANDRGLQLYKEKQYAEAEAEFTEAAPELCAGGEQPGLRVLQAGKIQGGGALVRKHREDGSVTLGGLPQPGRRAGEGGRQCQGQGRVYDLHGAGPDRSRGRLRQAAAGKAVITARPSLC
jgi:hypothetical protein